MAKQFSPEASRCRPPRHRHPESPHHPEVAAYQHAGEVEPAERVRAQQPPKGSA